MTEIVRLNTEDVRRRWLCHPDGAPIIGTHYEGCEKDHWRCTIAQLCEEVKMLQAELNWSEGAYKIAMAEIDRLQAEVTRLCCELAKAQNERDCK